MSSSDEDSPNTAYRYFSNHTRRPPPRFYAWSVRVSRAHRRPLFSVPEGFVLGEPEHILPTMSSLDEGPPAVNGVHSETPQVVAAASTAYDPSLFRAYLLALLPPVIGASAEELEATLFDHEFEERVSKFSGEGGSVIYVVKVKDEVEGEFIRMYGTREIINLVHRRRTGHLFLFTYSPPRLCPFTRQHSRDHQTYSHSRSSDSITCSTPHS